MQPPPPDDVLARWVATWRDAGAALARQKRDELECLSTPTALAALAAAFAHARRQAAPSTASGLVDQQRYFARLRR